MDLRAGEVVNGAYRLIREIGEGGMGTLWSAQQVALDRACVIKLMRPEVALQPGFRDRFGREARALGKIKSPYIVHVYDFSMWRREDAEIPYIAMELLEGEDLRARLDRLGALDAARTVAILTDVARGLSKAHEEGIIHRDLKPGNIFLRKTQEREVATIIDFGIAKSAASPGTGGGQTDLGMILGTPEYMSPEQADGATEIDHLADCYSLAVIAFECLTGSRPFAGVNAVNLILKMAHGPVPIPSVVRPGIPIAFDAWWAKAAARPREDRFQGALEMVDALTEALGLHGKPGGGARAGGSASLGAPGSGEAPTIVPSGLAFGEVPTHAVGSAELSVRESAPCVGLPAASPVGVSPGRDPVRVLDSSDNHCFAQWRNVLFIVWGRITTPETVRRSLVLFRRAAEAHGAKVALLTVVGEESRPPSTESRQEIAKLFLGLQPYMHRSAVVHEGSGFQAATVRMVVTGLAKLSNYPFPHKVFESASQACGWLVHGLAPLDGVEVQASDVSQRLVQARSELQRRAQST